MATKAQLLALAKAQRKNGNDAAARKLEARANGMGGGSGKRKRTKRTKNPARTRAAAKRTKNPSRTKRRAAKRTKNPSRTKRRAARRTKNPARTRRASARRTRNPSRTRRRASARRTAGSTTRRRRARRSRNPSSIVRTSKRTSVGFTGTKQQLAAMKAKLARAGKGKGQYLNLRTGKLTSARSIGARSQNPSIGSGAIVALAAGVALGAAVAELEYRFISTMADSFDSKSQKVAWVGRAAATRIAKGSTAALVVPAVAGVGAMGGGWWIMGSSPVLGAVVFGVGLGHVGLVGARLAVKLLGGTAPADAKGNELTLANRLAPLESDAMLKALDAQISYDNDHAQVTDATATVATLSAQDSLWTDVNAGPNLTPVRQGSGSAAPDGAQAGLGALTPEQRIRQVRQRLSAQGQRQTPVGKPSAALLAARRAAGLADNPGTVGGGTSIFSAPATASALGCGGDCGCDSCSHKHDHGAKPGRAQPPLITSPDPRRPASNDGQAPLPVEMPNIQGLADRAAAKGNLRALPAPRTDFTANVFARRAAGVGR